MLLLRECLQNLGFNLDLFAVVLQLWPIDQKSVFHALAQRCNLGQLHIDLVAGQYQR